MQLMGRPIARIGLSLEELAVAEMFYSRRNYPGQDNRISTPVQQNSRRQFGFESVMAGGTNADGDTQTWLRHVRRSVKRAKQLKWLPVC